MDRNAQVELEALMQRQGWVRALARSLVGDAAAAEDLAQDAWVAALERGPRDGSNLRGWLRRVLANLARQRWRADESRRTREAHVARHEAQADELASRLETFELVVSAVRELDEPYRSVVILRYFEELTPRQIAERLDVPLGTVETRLHRALERLRAKLDRRCGDRATWIAFVAPIAQLAKSSSGAVAGSLIVKTQVKLAIAFVVLLLLASATFFALRSSSAASEEIAARNAKLASSSALVADSSNAKSVNSAIASTPNVDTERAAVASPPATVAAPEVVLHGRVVDDRRMPVAGASVEVELDDESVVASTSGADGKFDLGIAKRPPGYGANWVVWARAADSRAGSHELFVAGFGDGAYRNLYLPPRLPDHDVDAGSIALLPATSIDVDVRDGDAPAVGASIAVEFGNVFRTAARATTDAEGRARIPLLPNGPIRMHARLGEKQGLLASFIPPAAIAPIQLETPHSLDVVVVDRATSQPIVGAKLELDRLIELPQMPDPENRVHLGTTMVRVSLSKLAQTTDGDGRATVTLPVGEHIVAHIIADGYLPYPDSGIGDWLHKAQGEFRAELKPRARRTVSWPIVAGELAAPADGAELSIRAEPGWDDRQDVSGLRGVVRNSELVIENFTGGLGLYAESADGAIARPYIDEKSDHGEPIAFRRTRKIEVTVREADGTPARGAFVQAHNQGNNCLDPWIATDAAGHAMIAGLYGGLLNIWVETSDNGNPRQDSAAVDLERGDGRIEVSLSTQAIFRLRTTIDGTPRLPTKYFVYAGGGARVVEELPELGELRVRVNVARPNEKVHVTLTSLGFLTAQGDVVPANDGSEPLFEFALRSAATLTAHVTAAKGERPQVQAERWNEKTKAWPERSSFHTEMSTPNGPGDAFVFAELEPGRYRVHDLATDCASSAVELTNDALEASVELDLSNVQWITGRVEAPSSDDLRSARVIADGLGSEASAPSGMPATEWPVGNYLQTDGSFKLRVPGDRAVKLRVWHPWLAPAADGGSIEVTGGRDGVVLKLAEGDDIRFAVPQLDEKRGYRNLRVAAYRGEPKGAPEKWIFVPLANGEARFGGLERGKWTLWIDSLRNFTPLVLRNVEVGAGSTTLAPANFVNSGSSIRLNVLVKDGQAKPRVFIIAMRKEEPIYNRTFDSSSVGDSSPALTGLEAGNYDVDFGAYTQPNERRSATVELDGTADAVLELDLR